MIVFKKNHLSSICAVEWVIRIPTSVGYIFLSTRAMEKSTQPDCANERSHGLCTRRSLCTKKREAAQKYWNDWLGTVLVDRHVEGFTVLSGALFSPSRREEIGKYYTDNNPQNS